MAHRLATFCIACLALAGLSLATEEAVDLPSLGRALFFDTNLSLTRKQACGSCHEPARAFSDGRSNDVGGAASVGDDNASFGERNAPSIAYASHIPLFRQDESGAYTGGLFLDGRAGTLEEQVAEPFLNPKEMAMPDRAAVVARVLENSNYVRSLESIFGVGVLLNEKEAFSAIAASIAAFERSDSFAAFDSKYDRYLRGAYQMSREEEIGRILFFSQMIGCYSCHLLDSREAAHGEVFTNHRYHNIGVPANVALLARNGATEVDHGLLANPAVNEVSQDGKFRVPSLRNVAVTGPYMHNGVFRELETAILFYDKYLVSNEQSSVNPETGQPWGEAEVAGTIDLLLLQQGQPITPVRASALAAFLRTLTDQRYEVLLE